MFTKGFRDHPHCHYFPNIFNLAARGNELAAWEAMVGHTESPSVYLKMEHNFSSDPIPSLQRIMNCRISQKASSNTE